MPSAWLSHRMQCLKPSMQSSMLCGESCISSSTARVARYGQQATCHSQDPKAFGLSPWPRRAASRAQHLGATRQIASCHHPGALGDHVGRAPPAALHGGLRLLNHRLCLLHEQLVPRNDGERRCKDSLFKIFYIRLSLREGTVVGW